MIILIILIWLLLFLITMIFLTVWKYAQQAENELINHRKGPISHWKSEDKNSEEL